MGNEKELVERRGGMVVQMDSVTLVDDEGGEISFTGYLYDQTSFYDEKTGVLTKQRLYATDDGQQAFSIVASDGNVKKRRAYMVRRKGDLCTINNGSGEMSLPYDWLMLFTQILWDIDIDEQRAASGLDGVAEDSLDEAATGGE